MKNEIKIGIALATLCLSITPHTVLAAGAGLDVLIGNTGDDRLIGIYESELGALLIAGNDQDNTIEVSATRDGVLLINKGEVRIEGGVATLNNTRVILMDGGAGNDILVARRMPRVAMRGGDGSDRLVWDNSDADFVVARVGDDELAWTNIKGADAVVEFDPAKVLGEWSLTGDSAEGAGGTVGGWGNDWYTCGTGRD